jgi:O-succinylbenzoate synthase
MWIWRYTLTPRRALSALAGARPREGALVREGDGFADVHPWPELGDAPLGEQLARLAAGEMTALTRRSLALAELDGAARREGRSLFEGLTIPESHWPGLDPPEAFDTVKLKGIERIPPNVRLRIDFNATLTPRQFLQIAAALPKERVDFIEDPCPYDGATWRALREATGLRLARDRGEGGEGVDVVVVKPAVQDPDVVLGSATRDERSGRDGKGSLDYVITSYMDHPVGQFFAAHVAAAHVVNARCGLFTHVLFERDPFIEQVASAGARLLPPAGVGIGFGELLERLPWRRLK